MKTFGRLLLIGMTLFAFAPVHAKAKAKKKNLQKVSTSASAKTTSEPEEKLKTNMSFEGGHVVGKYLMPTEGRVEVENEKLMNELIGFRKDFKDRLVLEQSRLKRGAPAELE